MLQYNLFAFYLPTAAQGQESDLTFGYYDRSKYLGEMVWHPVLFKYMYGIKLDDVLINGVSLGVCGPHGIKKDCLITVDSGTTYMSMPSWAMEKLDPSIPLSDSPRDCTD